MQKTTKLLFGIHMHQPVDNFDWVIQKGVKTCYGPFFDVMSKYPEFKFAVHCSGWLMEQIEEKHPKLYKQIVTLAEQGSIEFISAGYYEPILSAIPAKDRVTQIDMLNNSIKEQFNQSPKGLWLTERVWESSLIPDMTRAGIKYTVIDDYHFQCAGFDEDVLDGYFMSEEGGKNMGVFPISKKLRYAMPFMTVKSAIEAIKSYNRKEDSAAIIFDDAEKFGMWPGTHEWVYEKKWLENFVESVLEDDEIETIHFGAYYESECTRGITYLPNVSYYEMGEWSLKADDTLKLETFKEEMGEERYNTEGVKFLKGGIWRNFLVKYNESNRIQKRCIELSKARTKVDDVEFDTALYKAQTNDALWHGVFGGLYLPNLRDNAYRYIIEAENVRYGKKTVLSKDENELDGYIKVKAVTEKAIYRFDAAHGGQLVEFDTRKACFNWQNTLTRRKEAYHHHLLNKVPKDETLGIEEVEKTEKEGIDTIHLVDLELNDTQRDAIIYDWYLKNSFIDHISDKNFGVDNFRYCDFKEYGDFANQAFEVDIKKDKAIFTRDGGIYLAEKQDTQLKKSYSFSKKGLDFKVKISTEAEETFNYVLEHNFHFLEYETILINNEPIDERGSFIGVNFLEIYDAELNKNIVITLDQTCDVHYFQLQTLSQSEEGLDLTVQGISFAMVMPFKNELTVQGTLKVHDA